MQVKYPLCQLFTIEFLMAIIDLAYGDWDRRSYPHTVTDSAHEQHLKSTRDLAAIDGLIWW